ncbi:DUF6879 family protein [Streptomyces chartreusis]|uniref:DUF6879 family protein n=1 Tax=Streptomyces chartreusis TaxID=1969 RepID=UPI003F53F927
MATARAGQNSLSRRHATDIALPENDFWMFDSNLVLVNHFDGKGKNMRLAPLEQPQPSH